LRKKKSLFGGNTRGLVGKSQKRLFLRLDLDQKSPAIKKLKNDPYGEGIIALKPAFKRIASMEEILPKRQGNIVSDLNLSKKYG